MRSNTIHLPVDPPLRRGPAGRNLSPYCAALLVEYTPRRSPHFTATWDLVTPWPHAWNRLHVPPTRPSRPETLLLPLLLLGGPFTPRNPADRRVGQVVKRFRKVAEMLGDPLQDRLGARPATDGLATDGPRAAVSNDVRSAAAPDGPRAAATDGPCSATTGLLYRFCVSSLHVR